MKKLIATITTFLAITLPSAVSAHVKWFAEPVVPVDPYQLTDGPVIIWIIAALAVIGLGVLLEKKLPCPKWVAHQVPKFAPQALSLASIGFGAALIIFSIYGFVFAPNLPATSSLLLITQLTAGILIFLGFYERLGAFLVLVLFVLGVHVYGAYEMIDTLEMIGFSFYVLIVGRPKWKLRESKFLKKLIHPFHMYGVPILRIGTGVNLLVLGFTEKILAPSLTQEFLTHHDWNFMQKLGFEGFTDYWFAFSAGTTEALIGIFLILGLVTRVTTIVLAIFLLITLYLLGPIELIGHLPHFSIAIVLLVFGAGARLKLLRHKKKC